MRARRNLEDDLLTPAAAINPNDPNLLSVDLSTFRALNRLSEVLREEIILLGKTFMAVSYEILT